MSRMLITGSSGFIGTNFYNYCKGLGHDVFGLDLVLSDVIPTLICDVRDFTSLERVIHEIEPDYIVHLAARTDLDGSSVEEYDSNTLGTRNLVDIVNSLPSIKKVIFASSMLVCEVGYCPKDYNDFCPTTAYGQSKVKGEVIVRKNISKNIDFEIFRPTSIWGPGFKEPYANFFRYVLNGKYFNTSATCLKTYGFIDVSIRQIYGLLDNQISNGNLPIYIGDKDFYNISDWSKVICDVEGLKYPIVLPIKIFKMFGYIGDILKFINIKPPLTSFRVRNMTTDNKLDCSFVNEIYSSRNVNLYNSVEKTILWMKKSDNK